MAQVDAGGGHGAEASGEAPRIVGLLCGGGLLPLRVAEALVRKGSRVVAVCIEGEADARIEGVAQAVHWTGLARLGQWVSILKSARVDVLLMVGGVRKRRMFGDKAALLPDWRSVQFWYTQLKGREDHTILGALADEFEKEGIRVGTVPDCCPDLLVGTGCLTRRRPDERQWRDVRFAWPIAKQLAALQVGQCVVVKDGAVVAVEAIEGTDAALERGGSLAGGSAVAVKVLKEGHDERFDIPCIGPGTVDTLRKAGVSVLALEAGRTILLDREETRDKADAANVCVIAVTAVEVAGGDP